MSVRVPRAAGRFWELLFQLSTGGDLSRPQRFGPSIMSSLIRHRFLTYVPLLVAVAAVVWHLRDFLALQTLPERGDPALPFQGSDLTPNGAPLAAGCD